jgi:hypothetical protein
MEYLDNTKADGTFATNNDISRYKIGYPTDSQRTLPLSN